MLHAEIERLRAAHEALAARRAEIRQRREEIALFKTQLWGPDPVSAETPPPKVP